MRPVLFTSVLVVAALLSAACSDGGTTTSSVTASADTARATAASDAPVTELATGFNEAGFDLLRAEDAAVNAVLSPTSIGHALLMARAAADEPTADAIDVAFGLPLGDDGQAAHDAWNTIDLAIAASNGVATGLDEEPSPVVTIADRIWPATTASPDQDWVDLLATHHGADVELIDVSKPAESRSTINQWVSDQTRALIPELLPEGFITGDTVLVLTDAIYFKAQWQQVFGKYGESTQPFTLLDGSGIDVTFMRDLERSGRRGFGDGYAAAELAYLGNDYTMTLVVPDIGNYDMIRSRLGADLMAEIDGFAPGPYELLVPEWTTSSAIDLLPWLTEAGAAPGSYPAISPSAYLAGAVHGADIAVDDIGTVAPAATALDFNESGPGEPEFTIAADRPFFYVVRHVDSGLVLFVGQVTDPTT